MHAFDFGAEDENFTERTGFGKPVQALRVELEGKHGRRFALRSVLEVVRPQRCLDGVDVAAQDTVFVEARYRQKFFFDPRHQLFGFLRPRPVGKSGLEPRLEECKQIRRERGVLIERIGDVTLRIGDAGLPQIAGVGAQDVDFVDIEVRQEHETVERIVVRLAVPGGKKRLFKHRARLLQIDFETVAMEEFHVVEHHQAPICSIFRDANVIGLFADHAEAKVFQKRDAAGERNRRVGVEDLQFKGGRVAGVLLVKRNAQRIIASRGRHGFQVGVSLRRRKG